MTAIEDLERRVRTVEEEAGGEKHLTRYAVEQTQRNGDALTALRGETATLRAEVGAVANRVDHLAGDSAAIKAALAMHGRALDVVMQDIRQIRDQQAETNRKLDLILTRLGNPA
jgi:chromosome segregation ATPase